MRHMFVFLLLTAMAATSTIGRHYRPRYMPCVDSADCSAHECCVFLGREKFKIPRCRPRLELYATCDPTHPARGSNHSAHYPDQTVVEFAHIFYGTCPCERGLECDMMSNVCIDPIDIDFNHIGKK